MRRSRTLAVLLALLGAAGCSGWEGEPEPAADCSATGDTMGAVVTQVTFGKLLDDDTAEGLDLDGHDTAEGEEAGCYKQDFVSPDGRRGIDNQLAKLLPVVDEVVGTENLDALLEGAIANGQLLIMLAVAGVDDPMNDDCVDLRLGAGLGTPFLDTEGNYVPYQTFGFDERETPSSAIVKARIEDGVLVAEAGRVILPVTILDADFDLDLAFAGARLRVQPDPLGGGLRLSGLMGGGIVVKDFEGIVAGLTVGADVVGAIVPLLSGLADLEPDEEGVCQRVSAALEFETTPAFLYEGEPPEPKDEPVEGEADASGD